MSSNIGTDNLEVNRKVIVLITFSSICAILLAVLVNLSVDINSGVRAYVNGVGLWSQAENEANIHLSNYILTQDSSEYQKFKEALQVPLGDKRARAEMLKEDMNYEVAFQGLVQGGNDPSDIANMIMVTRWFYWVPQVQDAIDAWTQADIMIEELMQFAESVHMGIESGSLNQQVVTDWVSKSNELRMEISVLKNQFRTSMGRVARLVSTSISWGTVLLGLLLISLGIWLAIRFLLSAKDWGNSLREADQKFKNVINNSQDVLYKMNLDTNEYVYVSPGLKQMLGYEASELIKGGVPFILSIMHPDDVERMQQVVASYDTVDESQFLPTVEFRLHDIDGNWKWVSNVRSLVKNDEGKPIAIVGNVRDISKQKEQDETIKKSLQEKEILLQEIHHRVKNNLAIISSLLELQKDGMEDHVKQMLDSSQSRIKSIAKVHEKLYESPTLSDIQLDEYITDLTRQIEQAYGIKQKSVDIQIDVIPYHINIDDAIPLGLILNELINNAFKHAFKDRDKGILRIILKEKGDHLEMVVENNGHPIKEDFNIEDTDSLGLTLINVLIQRINGTLSIESGDWTRFSISFSLDAD